MEIPVLYAYSVWQPIEPRSKVKGKVIKNIKTTVWAITFETSGRLQNVAGENTFQNYTAAMTYDEPYLKRQRKHDFCMFSKFVNFLPIDLKIGTHIDRTYAMHLTKNIHSYK